jgi:hypothetical protein
VVQGVKTDSFTTTSTSYTNVTGLSATITPRSTSSKILVSFSVGAGHAVSGNVVFFRLLRSATAIYQGTGGTEAMSAMAQPSNNYEIDYVSGSLLDSPGTTSSITYQMTARVTTGTGTVNRKGDSADYPVPSHITLIEVAG